jgi:hypothetical protein
MRGGAVTILSIDDLRAIEAKLWPAPWRARSFEIDCPCPNDEHCGNSHTCGVGARLPSHDDALGVGIKKGGVVW